MLLMLYLSLLYICGYFHRNQNNLYIKNPVFSSLFGSVVTSFILVYIISDKLSCTGDSHTCLLCILTSFRVLRTPKSLSKHQFYYKVNTCVKTYKEKWQGGDIYYKKFNKNRGLKIYFSKLHNGQKIPPPQLYHSQLNSGN